MNSFKSSSDLYMHAMVHTYPHTCPQNNKLKIIKSEDISIKPSMLVHTCIPSIEKAET